MTLQRIAATVIQENEKQKQASITLGCWNGHCCYCFCPSGCGGGDGDGCVIAVLMLAVVGLAASFFVSLAATCREGLFADKRREQLKTVAGESDCELKTKLVSVLKNDFYAGASNTSFLTATTVGLGILTALALMTLHFYIQRTDISIGYETLMKDLALAGGSTVGGGLTLLTITQIISGSKREDMIAELKKA